MLGLVRKMITRLLFIVLAAFSWLQISCLASNSASRELEKAIEFWLNDQDELALPALQTLSLGRDEDAMLLLGQIANRTAKPSPFLSTMESMERNAILKAPGGVFGKPWLGQIKNKENIANALQKTISGKLTLKDLQILETSGLKSQVIVAIIRRYRSFIYEISEIDHMVELWPNEIEFMKWGYLSYWRDYARGDPEPAAIAGLILENFNPSEILSPLQKILYGVPDQAANRNEYYAVWIQLQNGYLSKSYKFYEHTKDKIEREKYVNLMESLAPVAREIAADAVFNASETARLRKICEQNCPQKIQQCTFTLFRGLGGYENFMTIQTPLDSLISPERYFASKRYVADIMRNVGLGMREDLGNANLIFSNLENYRDEYIVSKVVEFK